MTELIRIAANVATPIGLVGLVTTLVALYFYRRLKHQERLLQSLPPKERSQQVDNLLTRYRIDGTDFTKQHRFDLINRELDGKSKTLRLVVITFALTFVACFAIATVSYLHTQKLNAKGQEPITDDTTTQLVPPDLKAQIADVFLMYEYHMLFAADRDTTASESTALLPSKKAAIAKWLKTLKFETLPPPVATAMTLCKDDMLKFATGSWTQYQMAKVDDRFVTIFGIYGIDGNVAREYGYEVFADRIDSLLKFVKALLLAGFGVETQSILDNRINKERLFVDYFVIWTTLSTESTHTPWAQAALLIMDPEVLKEPSLILQFQKLHDSLLQVSKAISQGDENFYHIKEEPAEHFLGIIDEKDLDDKKLENYKTGIVPLIDAFVKAYQWQKTESLTIK